MDKGDLLHIGTAYVEVHTFEGKDYVAVRDFSTTTNALSKEILELEEENKKLKNMINTTIGIAYSKDDYDAIEYLVNERDRSEYFTSKDIKNGKTKRERDDKN